MKTREQVRNELDLLTKKVEAAWKVHEKSPSHENEPFICAGVGVVGRCTDAAIYLADRLDGEVHGYQIEDNPEALVGSFEGGHDFAVVDKRWLVDFWAKDTYQLPDLYDMADPLESIEVRRQYGDPSKWSRMSDEDFAHNREWLKYLP